MLLYRIHTYSVQTSRLLSHYVTIPSCPPSVPHEAVTLAPSFGLPLLISLEYSYKALAFAIDCKFSVAMIKFCLFLCLLTCCVQLPLLSIQVQGIRKVFATRHFSNLSCYPYIHIIWLIYYSKLYFKIFYTETVTSDCTLDKFWYKVRMFTVCLLSRHNCYFLNL